MMPLAKRLPLIGMACAAVLILHGLPIQAQPYPAFRVNPSLNPQVIVNNPAGFRVPAQVNPYYATSVYAPSSDPYSGYLSGAADVIQAQSQFMTSLQQAKLGAQKVVQERIQTRRLQFDEEQYERQHTPTREDEREWARIQAVRRSLNDPPLLEIWSANALNDLFVDVQKMVARNIPGPTIPLDGEVLQHINVTSGATVGSVGLLRDGGQLHWPLVLQTDDFATVRGSLDQLAPQVVKEAEYGMVKGDTLRAMIAAVNKLESLLKQRISDLDINDYIQGKRYVEELQGTVKALQDPNVSQYVTRKWAAKGNTVAELINGMIRQGLKFAPALNGDQAAYVSLHHALVAYDIGMGQLASAR